MKIGGNIIIVMMTQQEYGLIDGLVLSYITYFTCILLHYKCNRHKKDIMAFPHGVFSLSVVIED